MRRMSSFRPKDSCSTTTPGWGPSPGAAKYSPRRCPPSGAPISSCSALGGGIPHLLHHPRVSVGVAEREEGGVVTAVGIGAGEAPALPEVERLTDVDPPPEQLGSCCVDVAHDQMQPPHTARPLRVAHERDRARRARRRELDDAKILAGAVVDVQLEPRTLKVELLGAVNVGHR